MNVCCTRLGFLALVVLSYFSSSVWGAAAPQYSKPLAVFWVGADRGAGVYPPVDIGAMISIYETNHFRVMRFDGTSPRVMGLSMVIDRQKHPENYLGTTVPFVMHGNGIVGVEHKVPVTPLELASAFLVGIGGDAQADIVEAICLMGRQCREIPVEGTPLEKNVWRWLASEDDPSKARPLAATKQRESLLLGRLLDALLVAVHAVSPTARAVEDDPDGFRPFSYQSNEATPSPKNSMSFTELAEREALLGPKQGKMK